MKGLSTNINFQILQKHLHNVQLFPITRLKALFMQIVSLRIS